MHKTLKYGVKLGIGNPETGIDFQNMNICLKIIILGQLEPKLGIKLVNRPKTHDLATL